MREAIELLETELRKVRAHRDSLLESLECAPYPSDLESAEASCRLAEKRLAQFEASLRRMAHYRQKEGNLYMASCQIAAIAAAKEEAEEVKL